MGLQSWDPSCCWKMRRVVSHLVQVAKNVYKVESIVALVIHENRILTELESHRSMVTYDMKQI